MRSQVQLGALALALLTGCGPVTSHPQSRDYQFAPSAPAAAPSSSTKPVAPNNFNGGGVDGNYPAGGVDSGVDTMGG